MLYRPLTWDSRDFVTTPHTSRRYFSLYFGKRVANDDSSVNGPPLLSSGLKGSTFHFGSCEFIMFKLVAREKTYARRCNVWLTG